MKITIEIPEVDEAGNEYFEMLAERLGKHISELLSLGNMEPAFVAGIYRSIANAIDSSEETLLRIDANTIREGWFEGLGGNSAKTHEIAPPRQRPSELRISGRFKKPRDVERQLRSLSEVARASNATDNLYRLRNTHTTQKEQFVEHLDVMCSAIAPAVLMLRSKEQEYNFVAVLDKHDLLNEPTKYIDGSDWAKGNEVTDKTIVFELSRFMNLDGFRTWVEEFLDIALWRKDRDLVELIVERTNTLPSDISALFTEMLAEHTQQTTDLELFGAWLNENIAGGAFRADIEKKIFRDYPSLDFHVGTILDALEHFTQNTIITRKKKEGRVFFQGSPKTS